MDEIPVYEVIEQVRAGANSLLTMPEGPERMSLIVDIAHEFISAGKSLWYIVHSEALSPFRVFWLEGGIGTGFASVRSLWRVDDVSRSIIIWSLDMLRDNLFDIFSRGKESPPDLLVLGNFEYLGEPNIGSQLEEVVLRLPQEIPILAVMPPARNTEEILSWLEKVRKRPCRLIEAGVQEDRSVLAFVTPEWNLIPLLNKKRIATRVKRLLTKSGRRPAASSKFVQPLLSLIRKEEMTPSLVFMSSEKDCEKAVRICPDVKGEVGKVITSPQIAALFDRHPILKDRNEVLSVLSKRAGSLHSGHHPAWCEMIEIFLTLNHIDIAFTTISFAQMLMTGVKSVVLTTSQVQTNNRMRPATKRELDQVWKLLRRQGTDDVGCIMVANTDDIDVVHVKDLRDPRPNFVLSQLKCSCQTVLGLSAIDNMNPIDALNCSFFAAQKQPEDTCRLNEVLDELHEKIQESACNSPRAAIALMDIYHQSKIQLDRAELTIKKGGVKTEREVAELQSRISQLPCEKCVHQQDCQKMRYRKIRAIVKEYHNLRLRLKESSSILEVDFKDYSVPITELEFINANQELTNKGLMALRTGLEFPQPVVECMQKGVIPLDDSALSSAIVAGFVECCDRDRPQLVEDFIEQSLQDAYANIEEVLKPLKDHLLRLGVLVPGPFLAQSAVTLAWEKGKNPNTIQGKAGISMGSLMRLIYKGRYLKRQLM